MMERERIIAGEQIVNDEDQAQLSLRPKSLAEYIGQRELRGKLKVTLDAALQRKEAAEHILFYGPPGLGKTTLAHIIANEMSSKLFATSGPALQRTGDLMGILTNLKEGDILFIDEIHRLSSVIEEFMYPAMEDFKVDFVVDKGAFAKVINVPLKRFTLIGATTRAGMLSSPLRDRFGLYYHIDFYPPEDLAQIVVRSAGLLETEITADAALTIAQRSRGTPRIANRLLRRVRDYAAVKSDGAIGDAIAVKALDAEGVDALGLDNLDRKLLQVIVEYYKGGPVGIEALGATLNEEVDTLVDMVEPYLLKIGFIQRTRRGRMASPEAMKHLGVNPPTDGQQSMF
ncbi:MAG: Holliday junction branch migration DNA helicase RuvB [candidate division Zixibacteria bacterium]|nr:Holliday junction branch migration DNA helicase RuvB [candidate division Zixibacteria bacterium]MDH3938241.1 Holliday junction branch migration DNA helicase RuvB [candidate division Zixibacteria bacterium]MDH4034390.1 Holliday junction branch migration DNA helicase RuvB [candidate division Zixibacteria bacterium]